MEDYATPNRLAMYLEMGWSDFLLPIAKTARSADTKGWPDPMRDAVQPTFYQTVADLCRDWCESAALSPTTFCDVGTATGRLPYEVAARLAKLIRIVGVEPSVGFSKWAQALLCEDSELPPVPMLGPAGRVNTISAARRPIPLTRSTNTNISVITSTAEAFASKGEKFDLVTCLNVVDRHPEPTSLIEALSQLIKPGGLMICSSPLDFKSNWTPESGVWIDSLHQLFSSGWSSVDEAEAYYEFRYYDRVWTRFNCQVICKRKERT